MLSPTSPSSPSADVLPSTSQICWGSTTYEDLLAKGRDWHTLYKIARKSKSNTVEEKVEQILTFAGYGIASFMLCSLKPLVLQASGATIFNLTLLTADMWAVGIRVEKHTDELSELEDGDSYQTLPEEDSTSNS
ncbi:hypothetical protein L6452_08667 [Arctium lappa]|uniref:Uncharacterized protein n=1 Tax=Arctium lappa TaxID=4217 RepID=A0ACB9DHU5_ARCLA|nr:hypothetical protein L6452_08667 [Arctium lappa]